ncbi:MAG: glycosyltransferase family 39 protein [Victivallales bacterium]|nr:glycosyltransferase family 39 protein [Victivallales bacterium]
MSYADKINEFFKLYKVQWLTLGLFAAVILSVNVWSDGIYSAQEGRAALVARQMIESGNWLYLNIQEAHNTEKPVMSYWFYALSGTLFGINEFSIRLPSVLAALATVFITCLLGIRIYGRETGFLAGYILASMVGFVNLGRLARIDMVLSAFYTASMYLLYTGYFENLKANRRLYLFYVVLALSVMVKGPVSVVLVGLTVLALTLKERNWKILWELEPVRGLLIGLVINAPWYAYETLRTHGEFAWDFFLNQNISRFTGVDMIYCGGRRRSFLNYFPILFGFMLPWSLLIPFALINFRKRFFKLKPATYYLIIWSAVVFIFFSCAAVKRGDYLLPLFPPAAILLGRYLRLLIEKGVKLSEKWLIAWVFLVLLAATALIAVRLGLLRQIGELVGQNKITFISKRDGMNMIQIAAIINRIYILCWIAVALLAAYLYGLGRLLQRGQLQIVLNGLLAIILAAFCIFYLWIDPAQNKYKTVKYFCERARPHVPPNEKICYYVEWITETVFFMNRNYDRCCQVEEIYDARTGKMNYKYLITEPKVFKALPPEVRNRLRILEETIPGHQYPEILLKAE